MQCSNCGASFGGGRCPYCGTDNAGGSPQQGGGAAPPYGGIGQPTANDPNYQAAMGQPTAYDPNYQAAMGQPTANDPNYQAAMGQPQGSYGQNPYAPMVGQGAMPLAKKGCCSCLSVMMLMSVIGVGITAFVLIH